MSRGTITGPLRLLLYSLLPILLGLSCGNAMIIYWMPWKSVKMTCFNLPVNEEVEAVKKSHLIGQSQVSRVSGIKSGLIFQFLCGY